MKNYIFLLACILNSIIALSVSASSLRQINSQDGLSNSSVYCMYQDSARFLWLGTFDGLNMYDGRDIHVYKPDINNKNSLSSNVIRQIVETDNNTRWISTKSGLNKLVQSENKVETYYREFKDNSYIAKDKVGNLFVLGKQGFLSFYDKRNKYFTDLPIEANLTPDSVSQLVIDTCNTVWFLTKAGAVKQYSISYAGETPVLVHSTSFQHSCSVNYLTCDGSSLLYVDHQGNLYSKNVAQTTFIKNIFQAMQENGSISSMIYDGEDILIGFKTNGLIRLQAQNAYQIERININCGVFCLLKDEIQQIVWIGTDGQGVYGWNKGEFTFMNLPLAHLPLKKQRPVRAVYVDKENNLWLGTKDNGLIKISDYISEKYEEGIVHYTKENGLCQNEVFVLTNSPVHQVLWIGSNGPDLNYYSYKDRKLHILKNTTAYPILYVHTMFETQDSLLWIGAGNTLMKAVVEEVHNQLTITHIKRYSFDVPDKQPYNQIYSLHPENDSIIWVGTRGSGLIRFNSEQENYKVFTFEDKIAPMNDILCIYPDQIAGLWLGTSYGITHLLYQPDGSIEYRNFNENNGLPNNTIHGILEAPVGKLWLSSNNGIILFDPVKETFRSFNRKTGLQISEFSDNAYFKEHSDSVCFFGGVDGVVWITREKEDKKDFLPEIFFTKLRIFNKEHNISSFKKQKNGSSYIELKNNQNFFTLSFIAPDFINGENSRYSYRLENFSNVWIETGVNEAPFTNIPPGSYMLQVKYNDGTKENEDSIASIRIVVLPPWYGTVYAKCLYALLAIGLVILVFLYAKNKYERRKRRVDYQIKEKYKEEMYESKLRFFTNITHEISTPLTLIYGPCERILENTENNSSIRKYAQIIKSNAVRLNALIQEIIDFRRMETGNKVCYIESLDITVLTKEIAQSFTFIAEQNHIQFEVTIGDDLHWNSDKSCYSKILNNLISNAFKYTPENGSVSVTVSIEKEGLIIKVYNTGKGIEQKDIPLIFNRYNVLDNVKENNIKGLSSRNGLGLAICHSMTTLLGGQIKVESEVNKYACFILSLPALTRSEKSESNLLINKIIEEQDYTSNLSDKVCGLSVRKESKEPGYVLVIDDNKELLWLLKDILSPEYRIEVAEDGETGLQMLKEEPPLLIITDIMMPQTDGITLTRQIKTNKHTMHIPLIILSAKISDSEKIEGMKSGADFYLPKPFNAEYLKVIVRRLINNRKKIEEYYHSSASAFDFIDGQLLAKEDKDFLQSVLLTIQNNIDNFDFTPEELAAALQISTSKLYRKLKELNQLSPKDFIKEQKIMEAARLLVTTSLTVQEVMYKTGFINRSHFYKEFSKRYNQTPKEYREANQKRDEMLD